ncbi:MAG: Crp/Fnr family transcriptional regulator [Bacteroidaceae bacterium]|nr:Crp/Fnr family transcriptional regulator [Bacteroidaceae bacterium]MBR1755690.1 Crp/Fnr family transcriptional regulator [Bacteroidaceae bacterium]
MSRKSLNLKNYMPLLAEITQILTPEECELLDRHATVHLYKKNGCIYEAGEVPAYLHCLVEGKVKICKEGVGGRTQIVRIIKPVDYFGYRPAFAGEKYATSALAFEPSVIVRIPIGTIMRLLMENARLGLFFIERLATDLGQADARTVNLTQKHIRGRLAEALLLLRDRYGLEEDASTLSIYLSREDLANLSNMTTANAIRTLSAFANEKLLAVDGRKIKLIDVARLEKISRMG